MQTHLVDDFEDKVESREREFESERRKSHNETDGNNVVSKR